MERCFTPETARGAILEIRPVLRHIAALCRQMESTLGCTPRSEQRVEPQYFRRLCAVHGALALLTRRGIQVKDAKRGLVDFPARREGRWVLLCWQLDEPALGWWHEVSTGYAGRRRLVEDDRWESFSVPEAVGQRRDPGID